MIDQGEQHDLFSGRNTKRIASLFVVAVMAAMALLPVQGSATPEHKNVYVVGAIGDIAGDHLPSNNWGRGQYDDTARLITDMELPMLLMTGDAQHNWGTLDEYMAYFDHYYGALKPIMYPVPGNHDYYDSPVAQGYFDYFGDYARSSTGYYSFDLGSWHIVALNSNIARRGDGATPGTPQYDWLANDLATHPHKDYSGVLAYFHHPRFDWEKYQEANWYPADAGGQVPFWELLYSYGVDIVLNGHAHNYQRWAPQDPQGNYDPNGIREFVVGTGGYYLNELGHGEQPANLEYAQADQFGVLKLSLYDGGYDFAFTSISGQVLDSGNGVPVH